MSEQDMVFRRIQECKERMKAMTMLYADGVICKECFDEIIADDKRRLTFLKCQIEEE